jgi:hypothetical protein
MADAEEQAERERIASMAAKRIRQILDNNTLGEPNAKAFEEVTEQISILREIAPARLSMRLRGVESGLRILFPELTPEQAKEQLLDSLYVIETTVGPDEPY